MKIFHLSDLHIGLKLYNRDLLEDQKYILNLSSSSVHERASAETAGYENYGMLMNLAPIAEGTIFKLR